MIKQIDYDTLSKNYDKRFEQQKMNEIYMEIIEKIQLNKYTDVLEIGCGTGYWLENISRLEEFVKLCGIDLSIGMLEFAQNKKIKSNLINADAMLPPFKNNSFDFIFCVNVIHYFRNLKELTVLIFDLLKPGGIFVIFANDPFDHEYSWYVYEYYEKLLTMDKERFPEPSILKQILLDAGFSNVTRREILEINESYKNEDVFQDKFIRKDGTSQLASLTDEEYINGIEKMKSDILSATQNGLEKKFTKRIKFYGTTAQKI